MWLFFNQFVNKAHTIGFEAFLQYLLTYLSTTCVHKV
jgi:hypothetical protein